MPAIAMTAGKRRRCFANCFHRTLRKASSLSVARAGFVGIAAFDAPGDAFAGCHQQRQFVDDGASARHALVEIFAAPWRLPTFSMRMDAPAETMASFSSPMVFFKPS